MDGWIRLDFFKRPRCGGRWWVCYVRVTHDEPGRLSLARGMTIRNIPSRGACLLAVDGWIEGKRTQSSGGGEERIKICRWMWWLGWVMASYQSSCRSLLWHVLFQGNYMTLKMNFSKTLKWWKSVKRTFYDEMETELGLLNIIHGIICSPYCKILLSVSSPPQIANQQWSLNTTFSQRLTCD